MVRNKTISLWWILDNLIGVSGDNESQCVSVNMGRLVDVLPKTKRSSSLRESGSSTISTWILKSPVISSCSLDNRMDSR